MCKQMRRSMRILLGTKHKHFSYPSMSGKGESTESNFHHLHNTLHNNFCICQQLSTLHSFLGRRGSYCYLTNIHLRMKCKQQSQFDILSSEEYRKYKLLNSKTTPLCRLDRLYRLCIFSSFRYRLCMNGQKDNNHFYKMYINQAQLCHSFHNSMLSISHIKYYSNSMQPYNLNILESYCKLSIVKGMEGKGFHFYFESSQAHNPSNYKLNLYSICIMEHKVDTTHHEYNNLLCIIDKNSYLSMNCKKDCISDMQNQNSGKSPQCIGYICFMGNLNNKPRDRFSKTEKKYDSTSMVSIRDRLINCNVNRRVFYIGYRNHYFNSNLFSSLSIQFDHKIASNLNSYQFQLYSQGTNCLIKRIQKCKMYIYSMRFSMRNRGLGISSIGFSSFESSLFHSQYKSNFTHKLRSFEGNLCIVPQQKQIQICIQSSYLLNCIKSSKLNMQNTDMYKYLKSNFLHIIHILDFIRRECIVVASMSFEADISQQTSLGQSHLCMLCRLSGLNILNRLKSSINCQKHKWNKYIYSDKLSNLACKTQKEQLRAKREELKQRILEVAQKVMSLFISYQCSFNYFIRQ